MMLYIGSGRDMWPVIRYGMWCNHFIYVDALPQYPHYSPGNFDYEFFKDEESMVKTITDYAPGGVLDYQKIGNDRHEFMLNGGIRVSYFFNTRCEEAFDNPDLRDMVQTVTAIYVAGYTPSAFDFRRLENLKVAYVAGGTPPHELQVRDSVEIVEVTDLEYQDDNPPRNEICGSYYTILENCYACGEYVRGHI